MTTAPSIDERGAPRVRLGPFVLERPIGAGGMGEVWRGVHALEHVPVAIKVIGPHWARLPGDTGSGYVQAFEREVRAIAGLTHPGIVAVFDHGVVGAEAERASAGALAAESPYLVMEYMPRGSLEGLLGALDWPLVQVVARGILDALAHAHARGIVHCDLKPGNVLLSGIAEVAVKLTDFGVAHALAPSDDPRGGAPRSAGTPAYMAPEQLLGQWRDYGPWTDLYALGCLVWELCCGAPPFAAPDLARLAGLHLHAPPGAFAPAIAAPPAVEGWLRRLLAKRPRERFACAAAAAWALARLPGPPAPERLRWAAVAGRRAEVDRAAATRPLPAPVGPATTGRTGWSGASTVIAPAAAQVDVAAATRLAGDTLAAARAGLTGGAGPEGHGAWDMSGGAGPEGHVPEDMSEGTDDAPPLPADWRGPADAATSRALHGAGLGLYAFREVPLVGRARERDALWAALAEVHARREPRAVVVRGPSGVGKSRLVEWVAARAHEAGAATVLKAVHGPFGGPGEGLGRMLALQLQCVGLAGDEAYARVLRALADEAPGRPVGEALRYEAAALTEFMLPGDPGERPRVRLADPRERHAVLAGHLARVTARRPALVWLDDAMWGPAALAFARELLSRRTGPAALLVLTVRDDALDERPAEAKLLAELAALPATTTLALAPLADADHRALIRERLGLAAALVEAVLARAAGNPLFSLQVVGDWVGRGVLVRGDDGFALRGEDEALPADLHALWEARLERLLARWDADEQAAAWHALELAAALGPSIEPRAWAAACGLAGVAPPPGLALRLLEQRLAVPSRGGWAFVHGMLRETLERHAAEAGRRATHHRICAATLQGLHGGHAQGHAEEVARHFIAAGEPGEALVALLDANYQAQLGGDYERAGRALAEHEAIADRMGLPAADARRLRGRIQAVWLEWMRGGEDKLAAARARCEEIEAAARAGGHLDVVGEALRWRGMVARFERRWDEALAALAEAAGCFAAIDDAEGRARAALAQAVTLRALGRVDEAEAALVDAERLARARELFVLLPRILGNLAEIALQRGDLEAAEKRFVRALAAAEAIGDRKALGLTLGGAGDLALARDKLAAADEHYRRAEALFASLGSRYVHGLRLRRATLDLLRGETQAGHAGVQAFLAGPDRDPLLLAEAQLGLAVVAARRGEPAAFDDALAAGEHLLAAAGEARRVLVRLLEAAAAATDGARADRARAAATAHAARLVA